jgi:outer membrane protein OmpA-like peptidoglycan-associated protein
LDDRVVIIISTFKTGNMSFNLIDAAKGLLTSELVGKASSFLGESESGVSKAMSGILPTVMSTLANKTSSHEGAGAVAKMVEEHHSSGILGNLGNFFGNDGGGLLNKGAGLLSGLFGNKLDGLTGLISNFAGIKSGATGSLLSMALPMVLGLLGKHSGGNGASGIASLLSGQKDNIAAAMPAGLNLSSILGTTHTPQAAATQYATETVEKTGGGMRILLPLLLAAIIAAGAWYFLKDGCNKPAEAVAEAKDTTKIEQPAPTPAPVVPVVAGARESMKVKLANGMEIDAYKGGIESALVAFLDDKAAAIDTAKGNWYDFDNLNFKLGKSDLTDSSMVQIKNIAAILKAYPAVKMKIGGYTDASGNAASNLTLSQSRAEAVMKAIIASGGSAAQLTKAEGYGSKFAKEPATASDEARRKDRRTAVRIVAK